MPMLWGSVAAKLSTLTVDADLNMGAYKIKVDHLEETTAGHSVVIATVGGAPTAWSMAMAGD